MSQERTSKRILSTEDDFHASRKRLLILSPLFLKATKGEIKDCLMVKHEAIKGSCKMAKACSLNFSECCYP